MASVIRQAFIGEEVFVRQAKRKAKVRSDLNEKYGFKEIVQAVGRVTGWTKTTSDYP